MEFSLFDLNLHVFVAPAYLGGPFGDAPPPWSRQLFLAGPVLRETNFKNVALNRWPKDSSLPATNTHKQV